MKEACNMWDLVIKNGYVVSDRETILADIAVKNGLIKETGKISSYEAKRTIDASGKYVLPGVIEAHMHCCAPFQGCIGANDFYEQSISAAFGGVTTMMDFCNTKQGDSVVERFNARKKEMEISAIDYSVHGKFVSGSDVDEIQTLVDSGCPTFKVFTTYRQEGVMSDDVTIMKVFEKAKEAGGLPMIHCESNGIAEFNDEKFREKEELTWENFPKSKPIECETEAFARAIAFAKYIKCGLIVVHTTNGMCLDIARQAHKERIPVYVETGPHYLTLFDDLYKEKNGHLAICSPPLRTPKEAEELWKGIQDGTITLTGSDDCAYSYREKSMFLEKNNDGSFKQNYKNVVNGIAGIEIRLPLLLGEGVAKGRLSIEQVCALTSTNIAKVYGCYPRKGVIAPGSDADFVIVDMNKEVTISKDILHNHVDYCLHEGFVEKGWPIVTISNGNVIVEKGKFLGTKGAGRFIPRKIHNEIRESFNV